MGAKGKFFARVVDTNIKMMTQVMKEAAEHKGASIIEILANCVIFSNKVHGLITSRETNDNKQIFLEAGMPMVYGKDNEKGIILNGSRLESVTLGENGITEKDLLVHDPFTEDPGIHIMLANMAPPEFPAAMGVIRSVKAPTLEESVWESV